MPKPKKDSFFGGAAVLAAAIVVVKVLGAMYKIPLGSLLTDAAFADFNTAYYIYSLLLVISTGGLPIAVSKMVSEATALNRGNQVKQVIHVAMLTFCVMGVIGSSIMLFFPRQLADVMHNTHSYWSILVLAPAVFFICPMAATRGYFQGHSIMGPTAISQVIEAAGKLVFGLSMAWILKANGADESVCAAGAIAGVTISSALAMLFMLYCYRQHRLGLTKTEDRPESAQAIFKTLMILAIPITLSSSVMSIANLIDASLIQGQLQKVAGYTEQEARTLKGVFDKAVTLYNLPSQIMLALTISIIPAVSSALSLKKYRQAAQVSETALRTTAILIIPAGLGLSVLGEPIIRLLYPSTDVELAGYILSILGIAAIFVCLMQVSNSILQAYRLMHIALFTTIIGCTVKVVMNFILVANPDINIRGAAFSTLFCFGLIAFLNLAYMKFALPASPNYLRVFYKPFVCAGNMALAVWAVYGLCSKVLAHIGPFGAETDAGLELSRLGNAAAVAFAILVGVVIYFVLVFLTQAISKNDVALMPKGDKIARILHLQ